MLAEREHRIILYDFYAALLTDRQREVFTLHYMEDCSHAEIAAQLDITPQAVADMLRRTTRQLEKYDIKLHLYGKHRTQQSLIRRLRAAVDELQGTPVQHIKALLDDLQGQE